MMTLTRSLYATLSLACAIAGMPAHAVDFDGTFAGTVLLADLLPHTQNPPHPPSYYTVLL